MKNKSKFDPLEVLNKSSQRSSSSNPYLVDQNVTFHEAIEIPIDKVIIESNPRKTFNESTIRELAESISQYGLLQPIVVRKKGSLFELINGERRYRAHKLLKRKNILAIVKNVEQIDVSKIPEIKLVENLQREDLSEADLAFSLQELKNRKNETNEAIAKRINKSAQWVKVKISHATLLSDNIKDANVKKDNPIFEISSGLFNELAPLETEDRKKALDYLIHAKKKTGEFPARKELREFIRPLKAKLVKKKTKIKSSISNLDSLKSQLKKIKEKIGLLQHQKTQLEDAIKKAKK